MNRLMTAENYADAELAVPASYADIGAFFDANKFSVTHHSGLPLFWQDARRAVDVHRAGPVQFALKRAFDIASAASALLVLAPLLLVVAAIIKLSSKGPVLFRQGREGRDGETFQVLKFRSMRTEDCDLSGIRQTELDDPRITPIGKFIRRTSIDELPQLVNVLLGDMSLVGPRPHVAGMLAGGKRYDVLVPYYHQRLQMRPGLTGWAQANGFRGPTTDALSATARVDHDIAYIQNFSFILDLKIVLKTVINEFFTGTGH